MRDRLFILLQYLLPQHGLSRLIHYATRLRTRWFKNLIIRVFVRGFRVDMSDAQETDATAYPSFNAFFTRALKPDARPLPASSALIVSPVDGTISQSGLTLDGRVFQAKDREYSLEDLLGLPELAKALTGGAFSTIYLAPYNYHRIHMPIDGQLRRMIYLPGRLFSVNAATVRSVPRLFARNERVVCEFETSAGVMALILVGALNVGSIETVWAGEVAPGRPRRLTSVDYPRGGVTLARGEEMGRFNMGSTVIAAFAPGRVTLDGELGPGTTVIMGQAIGQLSQPPASHTG
ncbi:MAG: archaetidylserine decarboxylase [Gammaproteobacteria bacterium]